MHFRIDKQEFLNTILNVQRAIATSTNIAALKGIYMQARTEKLYLRATDLEFEIECILPVYTIEEGETVLPARYLVEMVRRFSPGEIDVKIDENDNKVILKSGKVNLLLYAYSALDFPQRKELESANVWRIKENNLKEMINQTAFAAAQDNIRPVFNGVSLHVKQNILVMVATNSHRLAYCRGEIEAEGEQKIIVPRKTLEEFARIYKDNNEEIVKIKTEGGQVSFTTEKVKLISRLIEANFFDYQKVLPKTYKTRIRIDTQALLTALERASVLSQDKVNSVHMHVFADRIQLAANTPEIGKVEEEIYTEVEGENNNNIAFNARYVIDVLRVTKSPEIYFDITGSASPCTIKPVDNENIIHLIMPVTTRN
jgi:DNA polymerase-3 subunit beta